MSVFVMVVVVMMLSVTRMRVDIMLVAALTLSVTRKRVDIVLVAAVTRTRMCAMLVAAANILVADRLGAHMWDVRRLRG